MQLERDDVFDFVKHAPDLRRISVGLGWDARHNPGPDFDLDATAFILAEGGKLPTSRHACFFNNKLTADGAVQSMGDNLTGAGKGDDETINVDLSKLDDRAKRIVFWVNIYDAANRKQSFEVVKNAYVRLYNTDTKEELCRYNLDDSFFLETAVEFAELNKTGSSWEFKAIGKGHTKSISDIVNLYR